VEVLGASVTPAEHGQEQTSYWCPDCPDQSMHADPNCPTCGGRGVVEIQPAEQGQGPRDSFLPNRAGEAARRLKAISRERDEALADKQALEARVAELERHEQEWSAQIIVAEAAQEQMRDDRRRSQKPYEGQGRDSSGQWCNDRFHRQRSSSEHSVLVLDLPSGVYEGANRYSTNDEEVLTLWRDEQTWDVRVNREAERIKSEALQRVREAFYTGGRLDPRTATADDIKAVFWDVMLAAEPGSAELAAKREADDEEEANG
jgi:hypothetical protein